MPALLGFRVARAGFGAPSGLQDFRGFGFQDLRCEDTFCFTGFPWVPQADVGGSEKLRFSEDLDVHCLSFPLPEAGENHAFPCAFDGPPQQELDFHRVLPRHVPTAFSLSKAGSQEKRILRGSTKLKVFQALFISHWSPMSSQSRNPQGLQCECVSVLSAAAEARRLPGAGDVPALSSLTNLAKASANPVPLGCRVLGLPASLQEFGLRGSIAARFYRILRLTGLNTVELDTQSHSRVVKCQKPQPQTPSAPWTLALNCYPH